MDAFISNDVELFADIYEKLTHERFAPLFLYTCLKGLNEETMLENVFDDKEELGDSAFLMQSNSLAEVRKLKTRCDNLALETGVILPRLIRTK